MSDRHSTRSVRAGKPDTRRGVRVKPVKSDGFPLFPHATGRWAKKILGKMYYFGPWEDREGALAKYNREKAALHSGRKVREGATAGGATIRDLYNKFLNAKQARVDSRELTQRSFDDYKAACDLIARHFGGHRPLSDLDPDDFETLRASMAKRWGPTTLGNTINRIRVVFKFAWENGLIDRPIRYGQSFARPSRKTVRLDRAKKGAKLFTAAEIKRILDAAGPQLRAMILLGINAGFGNADCGRLPLAALDLAGGWVDFPRPKTGIPRRAPLWPQTVVELRKVIAARPEPKNHADVGLVFITKYGQPWAKDNTDQAIAKEFGKLLRALDINGRHGLGFYTLRHTFRTVADEVKDQPAAFLIMGHEMGDISDAYRETISKERLRAITDHVRAWLFSKRRKTT
jgi:integrase